MKPGIYPSLISADLLNLEQVIRTLEPYSQGFHIDIMDNHFVPNLTWGPLFANAIAQVTNKTSWVHFMAEKEQSLLEQLTLPPRSLVTFHIETKSDIKELINFSLRKNWLPGIALAPKTPVSALFPHLEYIDHVLIMSVEPGFSGQQFMPNIITKLDELNSLRTKEQHNYRIGIDGGINRDSLRLVAHKGIELFAIAQGIFGAHDLETRLKELANMVQVGP